MATVVGNRETIKLPGGTEVELGPLRIKTLRLFMKKFEEFSSVKTEEEGTDVLVDAAAICLTKVLPDLAEDRDALEDELDMPTVYKIIEICTGIKLNDPNLIAAAMATTTADGQN